MKVKDLISNLEKRDQESEVYLESETELWDINEVTFGKHRDGKEFTVIIPVKEEEFNMKFYEFNDFGYYALIGAKTEEEAVNYYRETVSDIEEDDGPPIQITKEEARKKLIGACKEDEKEALEEFDRYTREQDPYLVLIDKDLL